MSFSPIRRKSMIAGSIAAGLSAVGVPAVAQKKYGPGVTDTEIKLGQTMPYSGPASAYGTMFYLTTGFHGLHVTGGLIAFLFVLGRTYLARRFTHEQAVTAIVVSYYWHFVDVVWIGLFATIYLIK